MLLCYKSDRAITYVFCRDLHLTFMFSGLLQNDLFQVFQTKLLSHLSNKVCRLLSSPVLLRKFTNTSKKRGCKEVCIRYTITARALLNFT